MVREWVSVNTDWFPILHRCIEPRNVWLQHPRGNETYGQCKLGDYSHAAVTCHIVDGQFNPDTVRSDSNGMALTTKEGIWRLDDTRSAYDVPPASIPNEVRTQCWLRLVINSHDIGRSTLYPRG
jgi:hypothetical protein